MNHRRGSPACHLRGWHREMAILGLLLLWPLSGWGAEDRLPPPQSAGPAPPAEDRIHLQQDDLLGRLQVTIDGQEAFAFNYGSDVDLPHFYPLRGPTGQSLLVQHPEPYPHHRAFWFADTVQREGLRRGNFYEAYYTGPGGREHPGPPFRDHIRHVRFVNGPALERVAQLEEQLVWEIDQDVPVLDEHRQLRIVALGAGEYLLDITFRVTAAARCRGLRQRSGALCLAVFADGHGFLGRSRWHADELVRRR